MSMETKNIEEMLSVSSGIFGPWEKYIKDTDVTDIDFNGSDTWIRTCQGLRFCDREIKSKTTKQFIVRFTNAIQTAVSKEFNPQNPILEAETEELRISIVHESVCNGRRSVCIRKTPTSVRIDTKTSVESGYASPEILSFLRNAVKAHFNIVICGEPGVGKTEFAKYVAMQIPDKERVITIEDNLEWHYHELKPTADCVEMQVSAQFSYDAAIKACLRQNPNWIMVSEVRGEEVANYLQQLTTGVHGITTVHTDDVRNVPDRLCNMAASTSSRERIEGDIYTFLDIAVLVDMLTTDEGLRKRYVSQVCLFFNNDGNHETMMIFDNGKLINPNLPPQTLLRFGRNKVENPFINDTIVNECKGLDLSSLDPLRGISSSAVNSLSYDVVKSGSNNEANKKSMNQLTPHTIDKRKSERFDQNMTIAIKVPSSDRILNVQMKNVSLEGIGFVSSEELDPQPNGFPLFVQMKVPVNGQSKPIQLVVSVVHSFRVNNEIYYGCHIQRISGDTDWKTYIKGMSK